MCGIAGIYHFDPSHPADPALLERMTGQIRHRGPDDEGYHVDRNVGLGFRRLAVLDLSKAGNQPMSNEDGSVWIIFNGEFYGYRGHQEFLKQKGHRFRSRTDTETILHLYEEFGIDCLAKIDGMFAFALWDNRTRELFLVRDRIGIKPLFYYAGIDRIVFGSEIKAILADPAIPRDIHPDALSGYLSFMTVPAPETIYQNIFKLLPGHYLRISGNSHRCIQYWDIPTTVNESITERDACDSLAEILGTAVRDQLVSDVPLGAFLSGGVDSSAVVAMMRKAESADIKTFSISFPGSEVDESAFARQVSQLMRSDHREFAVTPDLIDTLPKLAWFFDEPFGVSSAFATYFLARLARQHVTVALTGDGGDELFAGYPFRYSMDHRFSRLRWLPGLMRRISSDLIGGVSPFGPPGLRDILVKLKTYASYFRDDADHAYLRSFTFFDQDRQRDLLQRENLPDPLNILSKHYEKAHHRDVVNKRLYGDLKTSLVDEMLTKVDRMTMASSLEARVPLLDHRLVEFAATLPGKFKIQGRNGKLILKQALQPYLPKTILNRRKQGFTVPMGSWFRHELFEFLNDHLSEETVRRRGFFSPPVVRRMLTDHRDRKADNTGHLFILLSFELWYRTFMDAETKV